MQCRDSGEGRFKGFLSLAFIAVVIFAGVKIIPVYVNAFELQDYLRSQTPFWLTQHATAESIRNNILAKAQDLNLPVSADNLTLEVSAMKVSVNIEYAVPVNLVVYIWPIHFTASSENRSI